MIRVLFATQNTGKYTEFATLLNRFAPHVSIASVGDVWDVPPAGCVEDGETLRDNARLKAAYYRSLLPRQYKDMIVVAEDSGMQIEALGNAPGVHTRRWNGSYMTDDAIIAYCLLLLEGKANRKASFVSAYAMAWPDNILVDVQEKSEGVLLKSENKAASMKGLPFRSLFYVPQLGKMFHEARELPATERSGYVVGQEVAIQQIASLINPTE